MKYLKKKTNRKVKCKNISPVEVLSTKMRIYDNEAKATLAVLIDKTNEFKELVGFDKEILANLKSLQSMMHKLDEVVIDCAHKLAPYCSPKLESIEVKSNIIHKYVIKAPQMIKSTDEWAKITGAERARIEDMAPQIDRITPPAPSIHDFDQDEDEISTQKHLLN
jgi:hypothetical protein